MKEKYYLNLGEVIRKRRLELNLTQETLANMMEVDRKHLSQIENGKQNITFATFFKLCDALQMDPVELFAGIKGNGE